MVTTFRTTIKNTLRVIASMVTRSKIAIFLKRDKKSKVIPQFYLYYSCCEFFTGGISCLRKLSEIVKDGAEVPV